MHDAAEAGRRPVLGDEREQVLPCVGRAELFLGLRGGELAGAAVDHDGLAKLRRQCFIWAMKACLLDRNLGIVEVVVVEADLADRDAAWVGGEAGQLVQGFGGGAGGLLRMDAGAGVDRWQAGAAGRVGDLERLVHRRRGLRRCRWRGSSRRRQRRRGAEPRRGRSGSRCRSRGGRGCRSAAWLVQG